MAKLQEIVKKISEDQGQEEYKQKLRVQLLVYENVLPFIQEELAEAGNVTHAELEQMDEEYQVMLQEGHDNRQIQESLNKKIKMFKISLSPLAET